MGIERLETGKPEARQITGKHPPGPDEGTRKQIKAFIHKMEKQQKLIEQREDTKSIADSHAQVKAYILRQNTSEKPLLQPYTLLHNRLSQAESLLLQKNEELDTLLIYKQKELAMWKALDKIYNQHSNNILKDAEVAYASKTSNADSNQMRTDQAKQRKESIHHSINHSQCMIRRSLSNTTANGDSPDENKQILAMVGNVEQLLAENKRLEKSIESTQRATNYHSKAVDIWMQLLEERLPDQQATLSPEKGLTPENRNPDNKQQTLT